MSAHTPGPWTVLLGTYEDNAQLKIVPTLKGRRSTMYVLVGGDHRNANARLIAAAPRMLAQLKESAQWVAKLAADNDEDGNVIGVRAKRQVEKIDALLKEIEG